MDLINTDTSVYVLGLVLVALLYFWKNISVKYKNRAVSQVPKSVLPDLSATLKHLNLYLYTLYLNVPS